MNEADIHRSRPLDQEVGTPPTRESDVRPSVGPRSMSSRSRRCPIACLRESGEYIEPGQFRRKFGDESIASGCGPDFGGVPGTIAPGRLAFRSRLRPRKREAFVLSNYETGSQQCWCRILGSMRSQRRRFARLARSSVSTCVSIRRCKKAIMSAAWTKRLAWDGAKCRVSTMRVSWRERYPGVHARWYDVRSARCRACSSTSSAITRAYLPCCAA
ncbi:hypothetical protein STSO111631_16465 [Stackebrandtia soli]